MSIVTIEYDTSNFVASIEDQIVYLWGSYSSSEVYFSVPSFLELNAERIRAKYLSFIYELGSSEINGASLIDHLNNNDGLSYWWMTTIAEKSPYKSPRIYDCLKLIALEEMIIVNSPSMVILKVEDKDFSKSVERICDHLGIKFLYQPRKSLRRRLSPREIYETCPAVIRGPISLARHFIKRSSLKSKNQLREDVFTNSAFFCSYFIHLDGQRAEKGMFYSRQWGDLPKLISDYGIRANWIHHFIPSNEVPNEREGDELLERFNQNTLMQQQHSFLDTYIDWRIIFKIVIKWIWIISACRKIGSIKERFNLRNSGIWFWPFLQHEWKNSIYGPVAFKNFLYEELFNISLKKLPKQKIGFYLCEFQAWEVAFLKAWRKNGHGKIIGVPHSTTPFWHLYYLHDSRVYNQAIAKSRFMLPDILAVNGVHAKIFFIESGYPPSQIVEVEALRYTSLSKVISRKRSKNKLADINKGERTRVLILGDAMANSTERLLSKVEQASKIMQLNFEFTAKFHPDNYVDISKYPDLELQITNQDLSVVLNDFDVIISANGTSASLDAYISGCHVLIEISAESLNLNPLRGFSGVTFFMDSIQLTNALKNLLNTTSTCDGTQNEFFYLDDSLSKWKGLISQDIDLIQPR